MDWSTILKDIAIGLVSGFVVSPSNTILDKSVTEFANGKATVQEGVKNGLKKMIRTPLEFFTSYKFRWMYFVYGMTYISNNISDQHQWASSISIPIQNLLFTFTVNTICGISKDKAYAQHFGTTAPRPFPMISLSMFFMRDIITVASAFTFPPILTKKIQETWGCSEHTSKVIGQLLSPFLVQLIVCPLHLMGLDIYNREREHLRSRLQKIWTQYPTTATMRMIRFFSAYGIGGVVNNELRKAINDQ